MQCDYGHTTHEARALTVSDGRSIYVCYGHYRGERALRREQGKPTPDWIECLPQACTGHSTQVRLPHLHADYKGDATAKRCADGSHIRLLAALWDCLLAFEASSAEALKACASIAELIAIQDNRNLCDAGNFIQGEIIAALIERTQQQTNNNDDEEE